MRLPTIAAVDELLGRVLDEYEPAEVNERQQAEDLLASALCMYGAALRRARELAESHGVSDLAERWSTRQPLGGLLALHGAESPAPAAMATEDVDRASACVDAILEDLDGESEDVRRRAMTMLAAVSDLHEAGFAQLTGAIDADLRPSPELERAMGRDHLVAGLLLVHGLHPEPVEVRLEHELGELQRLSGVAASVELVELGARGARLRVHGQTPGDAYRLRLHVERVLAERVPDLPVEVEGGQEPTPGTTVTIPIESVTVRSSRGGTDRDGGRDSERGAVS